MEQNDSPTECLRRVEETYNWFWNNRVTRRSLELSSFSKEDSSAIASLFELQRGAADISLAMGPVLQGVASLMMFHAVLTRDVKPTLFRTRLTRRGILQNSDAVLFDMTVATLEDNINALQDRTADLYVVASRLFGAEPVAKARERYPHLRDPSTWDRYSPTG